MVETATLNRRIGIEAQRSGCRCLDVFHAITGPARSSPRAHKPVIKNDDPDDTLRYQCPTSLGEPKLKRICRIFGLREAQPSKYSLRKVALFAHVRDALPHTVDTASLGEIEDLAKPTSDCWPSLLETYVRAMCSAQQLAEPARDQILAELDDIPVKGPDMPALLFATLWAAMACMATVMWIAGPRETWVVIVGGLATTGLGVAWASRSASLAISKRKNAARRRERYTNIALAGVVAALMLPAITGIVTLSSFLLSQADFSRQRAAFEADPKGFRMIQAFAMRNFNTALVLGSADTGWKATSQMLPGASKASVYIGAGYCELNADPRLLVSDFNLTGPPSLNPLWIQGILIHELGHCLDVSREFSPFGQPFKPAMYSVAPGDRAKMASIDALAGNVSVPSTALWREALSDIMAVGYWRSVDKDAAKSMIIALETKRRSATDDRAHATMCWIRYAAGAPLPARQKELFAWADKTRSGAPCDPSQRQD